MSILETDMSKYNELDYPLIAEEACYVLEELAGQEVECFYYISAPEEWKHSPPSTEWIVRVPGSEMTKIVKNVKSCSLEYLLGELNVPNINREPPKSFELEWEFIGSYTERAYMFGGWIVKTTEDIQNLDRESDRYGYSTGDLRVATCFVPDPNRDWNLNAPDTKP